MYETVCAALSRVSCWYQMGSAAGNRIGSPLETELKHTQTYINEICLWHRIQIDSLCASEGALRFPSQLGCF